MQIYLLSKPKKAQVNFSWRNIHSLRAKSRKTLGVRFLPGQHNHCRLRTTIQKEKQECRYGETSPLQRHHFISLFQTPVASRYSELLWLPALLSLQSPTLLFTAITTMAQNQQLPELPGIFKTETKMLIYSLTLKQKGISSGTWRGSTVPHARSGTKREILPQNKKSWNKNREENHFGGFQQLIAVTFKKTPTTQLGK